MTVSEQFMVLLIKNHTIFLLTQAIYWLRRRGKGKCQKGELMTHNQIDYQKLIEDRRHNTVTEALTGQQIQVSQQVAAETARSNSAREAETNRANLSSEEIRRQTNVINAQAVAETGRHNRSVESETNRANIASENIKTYSNILETQKTDYQRQLKDANVALINAQTETESRRRSLMLTQMVNQLAGADHFIQLDAQGWVKAFQNALNPIKLLK